MNNLTNDYYSKNSEQFIESTLNIDMELIYQEFLPLIPKEGSILDAGCGSGRDSKYFSKMGYKVTAIDNCEDFINHVKTYPGIEAIKLGFDEVDYTNRFDGIWACASLLHVPQEKMQEAIVKLFNSMKTNGIFYASFKYGNFSGERNGRIFSDMDEEQFDLIIKQIPGLKVIKYWITNDQRPERVAENWLNVLMKKEI
jgi:SAM-dependent methyltransferase